MSRKEIIDKKNTSSNQNLSVYSSTLVQRGLDIANKMEIKKTHTFSEDEFLEFRIKYNQLRKDFSEIPEEFTNLETSNPHKTTSAFPINMYFDVFDKLALSDNYVLDYVYYYGHHSGSPLVYVRKFDEPPIETPEEFYLRKSKESYLDYLVFEKSFLGFFQFGLFCVVVDRFYEFWHACYNDKSFILTRRGLESYTKQNRNGYGIEKINKMLAIDPRPQVELDGAKGKVSLVYFDPIGGGLYNLFIIVEWPNKFIEERSETIVEGEKYLL